MLRSSSVCPVDEECFEWAREYLHYCICSSRDGFSLALGLLSVICWGVAEIPQIITNYKHKSTEGLSLAFLSAWIIGDLFNLVGCMLEPATLPTQYYMAMLYTATTTILTIQTIYYSQIHRTLKSTSQNHEDEDKRIQYNEGLERKQNIDEDGIGNQINCLPPRVSPSLPIPLSTTPPASGSLGRELYYMSARSLTMTHTPPAGMFPGRRTSFVDNEQSSVKEPLLSDDLPTHTTPPAHTKSVLCSVSFLTLILGTLYFQNMKTSKHIVLQKPTGRVIMIIGRKLLQVTSSSPLQSTTVNSYIASFLGWGMAAIYVGGRLPQILLNIRKGNFEGLNPLMFMFAVFGNGTYVASILVNSMEWSQIRPNLPWLVDAGGCVLLDTFPSSYVTATNQNVRVKWNDQVLNRNSKEMMTNKDWKSILKSNLKRKCIIF